MPDKSELNRARVYLVISLVWMAVIFAFSHQAHSGRITEEYLGRAANVPVRKLGHVSEFALLSWLYWKTLTTYARANHWRLRPAISFLLAFIAAFSYACTDEWHQAFVPGRSSSFYDVLVDASGMVIALVLTALIARSGKPAQTQHPRPIDQERAHEIGSQAD